MRATLDMLRLELFLRLRDEKKIVWKTRDDQIIPINDMTMSHLLNTINFLECKEQEEEEADEAGMYPEKDYCD